MRQFILRIKGKKIVFIFCLFFYLYMPIVCGINSAYLVGIIGCAFLLFHKCRIRQKLLYVAVILIFESVYVLMIGFISTGEILNTVGGVIYLCFFTLPAAFAIVYVAKRRKYDLDDMIECIAITAMIQAILSIACYLFGGFRNFLLVSMGYNLNAPEWADIFKVRLYGYANGLLYAMPAVQAIIGTITLLYALMKRQKTRYVFMAVLIWFSGIINGRTAFVIIAIGVITILSLLGEIPIKHIQRMFVMICGGSIIALCGILCFGNKANIMWLGEGLAELLAFVTGKQLKRATYFDALFSTSFLTLPRGTDFFFGTGKYPHSDVGFVRNLWRDGLFFTIIMYCILIHFIYQICKMVAEVYGKKIAKRMFAFSILTWILLNIKGEAFGIGEICNLIVLFYIMSFYIRHVAKKPMTEEKTDSVSIIYEERRS